MSDELSSLLRGALSVLEADYRAEALRAGLWYDAAQAYATARLADPDLTLTQWRRQQRADR